MNVDKTQIFLDKMAYFDIWNIIDPQLFISFQIVAYLFGGWGSGLSGN